MIEQKIRKQHRINGTIEADVEERGTLADRVLFWLLKHPYQRGSDLAFVFQVHHSTVWRHLQGLTAQALVQSVLPTGVTISRPEAVYYLTTGGIERIANLVGGTDAPSLARMWHVTETDLLHLLPRLASYLLLQETILRLIADAPRQLAYPGGHPAAIRWHWQHDYRHTFERKKKQRSCRADGAVVFRRSPLNQTSEDEDTEAWYCVLFLTDPGFHGSEDLRLMRERLEQILLWRESSERWSFYQAFPLLLVLAPTAHQRDLWVHTALEAAAHLRVAPLKGACTMVGEDTPWRSSWYSLDGSGTVSLQSLVTPLAPLALPPGLLAPKFIEPGTVRVQEKKGNTMVVTGNFQTRAKHLEMRTSDLKTTTALSLLSLHVSHRHIDIIKHLYALPLIAPHELAALLCKEEMTQQRYLYDLYQFHCLETRETVCGKRLILTEVGLRLLSYILGVPLIHIAERDVITQHWQQRGVKQALRTMEHTAGIYTFLAQLQQQAHTRGQAVLWWETTRSFRRYHYQGAWHNLMPDALLEYQANDVRVEAWLEWDTGSMNLQPLEVKFEAYAQYVRSRQYRHEHRTPPVLLLVVPHTGREQSLRRIAASILGSFSLTVWTTTGPLLKVQGPLAAIWKPGLGTEENRIRSTWVM